jgi:hypothetical protein
MKKILIIFKYTALNCILLLSFNAKSQTEQDSIIIPLLMETEIKDCKTPILTTTSIVRYENDADLYVAFEGSEQEISFILTSSEGRELGKYDTQNLALVIEKLPLNQTMQIKVSNQCDEEIIIKEINTLPKESSTIDISKNLFDELKNFVGQEEKIKTFDFIKDNKNINEIEKLSFIQEYFYDNEPLQREEHIETPPSSTEGCNCKVIRHNQSFSIGGGSNSPVADNSFSQVWDKNSRAWGATSYVGAAKYMQLWSYGKRIHSRGATIGFNGQTKSALFHTLEYNWFCTGSAGYPSTECGDNCEKDINYTARYDTQLTTQVDLPSCFMCGDKGTVATAEDAAILVIGDHKGKVDILDGGQAMAQSNYSKINNPDFAIAIGAIALDVVIGAVAFCVPGLGPALLPSLIADVTPKIKTAIKTPAKFISGNGGTKDEPSTLINQKGIYPLKPNTPTYFRLYSFGNLNVNGFTSWNNTARIVSDGNIAGAIWGGTPKDPACCSDQLGNWVATSISGAPMNLQGIKQDISNFMNLQNIPYNQTEAGFYVKSNNCKSKKP